MKIGFLAHPTTAPLKSFARTIDLTSRLVRASNVGTRAWTRDVAVPYGKAAGIASRSGATCEGELRYFPMTTEDILGDVGTAQRRVENAVRSLSEQGCDLVGLGGATSIVGGRGTVTARNVDIPLTSGNSLTTYAGIEALYEAAGHLGYDMAAKPVTVVGYPGSIALAAARLLLQRGAHVLLVHSGRSSEAVLRRHLQGSPDTFEILSTIEDAYRRSGLFFSATSTGGVIQESKLRPGSVVVDVALPRDVVPARRKRVDVMVLDGGYLSAGEDVIIGASLFGLTINRQLNACLAETIVLGLEGRAESFSLGRDLPIDKVLEIGEIAQRHGFEPRPLSSHGRPVRPDEIRALASRGTTSKATNMHTDTRPGKPASPRVLNLSSSSKPSTPASSLVATELAEHLQYLVQPEGNVAQVRAVGATVQLHLDMGLIGAVAGAMEDTLPRLPEPIGPALRDAAATCRTFWVLAVEIERWLESVAVRCLAQKILDEHGVAVETRTSRFRRLGITLHVPPKLSTGQLALISDALEAAIDDFSTFTPTPIRKETDR